MDKKKTVSMRMTEELIGRVDRFSDSLGRFRHERSTICAICVEFAMDLFDEGIIPVTALIDQRLHGQLRPQSKPIELTTPIQLEMEQQHAAQLEGNKRLMRAEKSKAERKRA